MIKKEIKVLLTFDYELPLGGVSNYQHGLFDPADKLIARANHLHIPIVLFTDICSAIRFKEWDYQGYYLPFRDQVHRAIKSGHDVQLHIHPHWMTSHYQDGNYIPSTDFSLSNFASTHEGFTLEAIIKHAYSELLAMGREVDPHYACVAFRAGGYDVEPESKRILTALNSLGVKIDSSVIKEFYLDYSFSKVDYTHSPAPSSWFVSTEGPLLKQASAGLLELPISSKPTSAFDIMSRRLKKIINRKNYASRIYRNSGKGFLLTQGKQSLQSKLKKITNPLVLSLDREYVECVDLMSIVDYNIEQYANEPGDLILTAIGHPKSMGIYHVDLMEEFVLKLRERFKDKVSFVSYQDIVKKR